MMDTATAVQLFITAKRAKGLSFSTLTVYRYRLDLFARQFMALPTKPEPIESWLANPSWSAESKDTYYRLLRNFYRWLSKRKNIPNPISQIEPPALHRKIARSLERHELMQLLAFTNHSQTVKAFLYLLIDTGLRLSEALSITSRGKFNRDRGTVSVSGKTGDREVPVSPWVRELVCSVLPWPWASRDAAGWAVRKAFRASGITGRRSSAHTLRHTFVRLWEGDESLLVGIMGWTTSRMMRVYRPYDVKRAVQQHSMFSPLQPIIMNPEDIKANKL